MTNLRTLDLDSVSPRESSRAPPTGRARQCETNSSIVKFHTLIPNRSALEVQAGDSVM